MQRFIRRQSALSDPLGMVLAGFAGAAQAVWVMFPTPQAPGMASLAVFVVAMLWFSTTRGLFSPNGMNRNVAIAPDVNEVLT